MPMPSFRPRSKPTAAAPGAKPGVNYDRKGRCPKHPQICLRKRGALGIVWTTVRLRCPLCEFEDETTGTVAASKAAGEKDGPRKRKDKKGGNKKERSRRHRSDGPERSSSPTSNAPTVSTLGSNSSSNSSHHLSYDHDGNASLANLFVNGESLSKVVCGMPYSCAVQNRGGMPYPGFYTGLVCDGMPHGAGTWRACHNPSIVVEGEWVRGLRINSTPGHSNGCNFSNSLPSLIEEEEDEETEGRLYRY